MQVIVDVSEWDEERIREWVVERLAEKLGDLSGRVEQRVAEVLDERLKSLADERLVAEIEAVVRAGVPAPSPRYGQTRLVTFREAVLDQFFTKTDGFRDSGNSWISQRVKETLNALLAKEFAPEIEKARASLREQLDQALSGSMVKALRDALGLR